MSSSFTIKIKKGEDCLVVIFVLACEIDQPLGITIGVLNSCGFQTRVVESCDLCQACETVVIIGKHPRKKHNGDKSHRRRFTNFRIQGFDALGYADGADIDSLWWRDLYYKLRQLIQREVSPEDYHKFFIPLERLKEMSI